MKPAKGEGEFASIAEDNTMRIWNVTDMSENCVLDMNSLKNVKMEEDGISPGRRALLKATAFDCSREYFSAIGCKDGTLHVGECSCR